MTFELHVAVTQDDIVEGRIGESRSCPIACALRRQGVLDPQVGLYAVLSLDWGATLPYEASAFVDRFDHEQPVEPIEFNLQCTPFEDSGSMVMISGELYEREDY